MSFIIIETFGGPDYAIVVTDENGYNKVFEDREAAEAEAAECQLGVVFKVCQ